MKTIIWFILLCCVIGGILGLLGSKKNPIGDTMQGCLNGGCFAGGCIIKIFLAIILFGALFLLLFY